VGGADGWAAPFVVYAGLEPFVEGHVVECIWRSLWMARIFVFRAIP